MKIGVVSDTHGFFEPRLRELLDGVERILHAGDVGSLEVLEELGRIAPVEAVRGNVDSQETHLPPSRAVQLEGARIELQHTLPAPQSELEAWSDGALLAKMHPERRDAFLKTFHPATRVVIFGHSHQPCLLTLGHTLFFNPGSAGKKRFSLPRTCALLEVFPRGVRGTVLRLDDGKEKLPASIWMPVTE